MSGRKRAAPRSQFARVRVTEDNVTVGSSRYDQYHRDRYDYDRQALTAETLKAFRLNPLARRIVRLYRQFSIGANVAVEVEAGSGEQAAAQFVSRFWRHPVNDLQAQIPEWFDERTLTGNLFLLFSEDAAGMPLVRALPSESISSIETRENDYRQETVYHTGALAGEACYPAYDPGGECQTPFVRHYVINRPVGSTWGESDLFPLLPWLARYSSWLENRAVLNYYRSLFTWVISGDFKNTADLEAKRRQVEYAPPRSNTVLVKDRSEEWTTVAPHLESQEAGQDGLALKKHIAAGAGLPLHFLAEPESNTRTTAEAAGTPTFRNFQEYQQSFFNLLRDVLAIACALRRRVEAGIPPEVRFVIRGQDISERDNSILALSLQRAVMPLGELYDRKKIDTREFLRLAYRFAGEVYDQELPPAEGLRRPLSNRSKPPSHNRPTPQGDESSGDEDEVEELKPG